MTAGLEGGEWSAARPGRTLPPGKTRYPFYRRLGGPQSRSGRAENLAPTGIRFRTVHPVAQLLYRLSYPARIHIYIKVEKVLKNVEASAQFQEAEAPSFQDNRHMKVVRLSVLRTGRLYP